MTVVKWSGIQMVGLKTGLKKPAYGSKCPVFKLSAKSHDYHLNTGHVQYSDGYCTTLFTGYKKVAHRINVYQKEIVVEGWLVADWTEPLGLFLVHFDVQAGIETLQVITG